ncbi:hypothetical protein DWF00_03290 [Bosea caraganae]|uniref:Antibiotic biosynthesis monooxygenase n=2 Tax=Bosea caraganae TaxID=2763117 RepID=A0A370L501_9HYPH|nr:hypothetical protein DWE98_14520 [Bosea caraganae]RDJ30165.1 hypothetical protein DWF00_03290 [Bosea caraganae]
MVVRQWCARATQNGALAYREHLEGSVLPQLRALPGFAGVSLLNRPDGGEVVVTVLTRWDSMDAVAAFAAPDLETAVVEPAAAAVLLNYDAKVTHHHVMLEG